MTRKLFAALVTVLAGAGSALGQAATLGPPLTWGPPGSASPPTPTYSTSAQPPTPAPPPPTYNPAAPPGPPDPILGPAAPPPGPLLSPPVFGGGPVGPAGAPCFWVSGEYLLWWVRSTPLSVPLVTTGDVNAPVPGALGDPSTRVVLGDQDVSYGPLSGFRLSGGGWVNASRKLGVEASGFVFGRQSKTSSVYSGPTGTPFLAVPVFSVAPAVGETALPLSVVGVPTGASVTTTLRLWGAELNGLYNFCRTECFHVDGLIGFRYLDLTESLNFYAAGDVGNFPVLAGFAGLPGFPLVASSTDTFATRNQFYGGQLGGKAGARRGRFTADAVFKLALGSVHESLDISGARGVTASGLTIQERGGVFAQPSNIGNYTHDTFAVVPEVQLFLGVDVTKCVNLFLGYDFLYLSEALRPGAQIDRAVNLRQLGGPPVGPPRPAPFFQQSDFWAQGLTFGVLFH